MILLRVLDGLCCTAGPGGWRRYFLTFLVVTRHLWPILTTQVTQKVCSRPEPTWYLARVLDEPGVHGCACHMWQLPAFLCPFGLDSARLAGGGGCKTQGKGEPCVWGRVLSWVRKRVLTGGIPEALALPPLWSGEQLSSWGLGVQRSLGCKCAAHYLTEFRGEGKSLHWESQVNGNPSDLLPDDTQ